MIAVSVVRKKLAYAVDIVGLGILRSNARDRDSIGVQGESSQIAEEGFEEVCSIAVIESAFMILHR
jgi:hypothetical protein